MDRPPGPRRPRPPPPAPAAGRRRVSAGAPAGLLPRSARSSCAAKAMRRGPGTPPGCAVAGHGPAPRAGPRPSPAPSRPVRRRAAAGPAPPGPAWTCRSRIRRSPPGSGRAQYPGRRPAPPRTRLCRTSRAAPARARDSPPAAPAPATPAPPPEPAPPPRRARVCWPSACGCRRAAARQTPRPRRPAPPDGRVP